MSSGPTALFREGLDAGELRYQVCDTCGAAFHRPRVVCPTCGSPEYRWRESRGVGTVYSVTVVERPPEGFEGPCPVVLVDLDEGFRMVGRVGGAVVAIGARVQLEHGLLPLVSFVADTSDEDGIVL